MNRDDKINILCGIAIGVIFLVTVLSFYILINYVDTTQELNIDMQKDIFQNITKNTTNKDIVDMIETKCNAVKTEDYPLFDTNSCKKELYKIFIR